MLDSIVVLLIGFCIFLFGFLLGASHIESQAFERGYMIECIGKKGYYWECEND